MGTLDTINIEQRKYDQFMRDYRTGVYGALRLGQAFFNRFKLDHIDLAREGNLYELDGDQAMAFIRKHVTLT